VSLRHPRIRGMWWGLDLWRAVTFGLTPFSTRDHSTGVKPYLGGGAGGVAENHRNQDAGRIEEELFLLEKIGIFFFFFFKIYLVIIDKRLSPHGTVGLEASNKDKKPEGKNLLRGDLAVVVGHPAFKQDDQLGAIVPPSSTPAPLKSPTSSSFSSSKSHHR